MIFVSEAVRVSSLAALHKQYQRLVVGRLVPGGLSPPKRSSSNILERDEARGEETRHETETDLDAAQELTPTEPRRTSLKRLSRNSSATNCDPPSPPLTPTRVSKERPGHDGQSVCARTATGSDPRPKNSVFSVFCPEALKYQVDLEKALPVDGVKCWCGYDWKAAACAAEKAASVIKDGFRITPRFLGKSHCADGLGCVLCTVSSSAHRIGSRILTPGTNQSRSMAVWDIAVPYLTSRDYYFIFLRLEPRTNRFPSRVVGQRHSVASRA